MSVSTTSEWPGPAHGEQMRSHPAKVDSRRPATECHARVMQVTPRIGRGAALSETHDGAPL